MSDDEQVPEDWDDITTIDDWDDWEDVSDDFPTAGENLIIERINKDEN